MKKIRVAILGQGRSGRDIHGLRLVKDRRYKIMAVVEPVKERRDRAAKEYGCDVYKDYRPLLKRDDIDLVVNSTPSHLHFPINLAFLQAGFNVLCEKPLVPKVKQVDALIAAAKKSRKLLAIYQQSRYAPYFEQVRKVIDSGVLGKIIQVSIAFNGFSRRWDWQTLTEYNGGNLLNTGPHPMDQALQLLNSPTMPEVTCFMNTVNTYGDAEDHVFITLKAKNRPLIHLEISSCCTYPRFTYNVYGTNGGMLIENTAHAEWKYFKPEEAPKLKLTRKPISKPDGTPAYCSQAEKRPLKLHTKRWTIAKSQSDLFKTMGGRFYNMLYKTLTEGAPLEITPGQVRQQIAVIEECHRQNKHIYGRKKK